jgi:hypothetical protein
LWLAGLAASSSRSLDQRVACRSDRTVHVLFRKECAREECGQVFEHCGCEPGRRYCGEKCSAEARSESAREARDTYNARDTEEGLATHAAEEAARRERIREKQRPGPGTAQELTTTDSQGRPASPCDAGAKPLPTASASAPEPLEAGTAVIARMPEAGADTAGHLSARVGDQRCAWRLDDLQRVSWTAPYAVAEAGDAPPVVPMPPSLSAREERGPGEWILVVPPELLGAARRREGALATCPFCGRCGRIRRVVSSDQWRRWIRRGLDPP